MRALIDEIRDFQAGRAMEIAEARQSAALFLMCRVDLRDALATAGEDRARLVARLVRLIERERLKGAKRHWSYDLNRHIALKEVLDRLLGSYGNRGLPAPTSDCGREHPNCRRL